ncbi:MULTISPECIES: RNA polymerase sigma factor [unclassified Lysobacter]
MHTDNNSIAVWVAEEILPHEPVVRSWLIRHWRRAIDVDDVIQEAYCRISELDSVAHIRAGRSYFFTTARAVAIDMTRSAGYKNTRAMTEIEWLDVIDDGPTPDRAAEASQELERATKLLSQLSWTCRQVIELRRVHGLSQAETARRLGVSENVVENHIVRGIRRLLKAVSELDTHEQGEGEQSCSTPIRTTRQRTQRRNGQHG